MATIFALLSYLCWSGYLIYHRNINFKDMYLFHVHMHMNYCGTVTYILNLGTMFLLFHVNIYVSNNYYAICHWSFTLCTPLQLCFIHMHTSYCGFWTYILNLIAMFSVYISLTDVYQISIGIKFSYFHTYPIYNCISSIHLISTKLLLRKLILFFPVFGVKILRNALLLFEGNEACNYLVATKSTPTVCNPPLKDHRTHLTLDVRV